MNRYVIAMVVTIQTIVGDTSHKLNTRLRDDRGDALQTAVIAGALFAAAVGLTVVIVGAVSSRSSGIS